MRSAGKEPSERDDRAEGQSAGPDENQLEMFEAAPIERAETRLPRMINLGDGDRREGGGRNVTVSDASTLRFLDVNGTDPEELRRLEESIRWLMNEGSVRQRLPRAATLPPVRGLPPVEAHEGGDSLVLNPDSLFPPRVPHRRESALGLGGLGGLGKFLLASAIAAPAAYFIASWVQRADTAVPSDMVAVTGSFEDRLAAMAPAPAPAPSRSRSLRPQPADEISTAPQAEPMATRAIPPMDPRPAAVAEPNVVQAVAPLDRSPGVAAVPPDPALRTAVAVSSPPTTSPGAATPKAAVLSAREIAAFVERGRILFDSGDLAAARLFFRRAANAGDASAALAMGATYDPDVLAKRFIRGIGADASEARMWYEKARELGSPESTPRSIEMLAQQQQQQQQQQR